MWMERKEERERGSGIQECRQGEAEGKGEREEGELIYLFEYGGKSGYGVIIEMGGGEI